MDGLLENKISQEYKNYIIDVFSTFITFCDQHNLQYFCCGGTAIGVVRHQGMIPWDDDIDVLMPRADYDRFLELMEKECPEKYEIINPKKFVNYYLPFAKFCKRDSTILEHKEIPCAFGANIDIFPLDGASTTIEELQREYLYFRRNANKLYALSRFVNQNVRMFFRYFSKLQLRTAWNEFQYAQNKNHQRSQVWNNLDSILYKHKYEQSDMLGNYAGMWGLKEFGPKSWFDDFIYGEFEGLKVKLPIGYDELLTKMYGDYMTPPPEEKRVSHHHLAFIDLKRKVPIQEILKKL